MSDTQNSTPSLPQKQSSETDFRLLKVSASSAALLTLILVLLGFGVSLAVESKLTLPHSSLYESSVELLDLGSVAVIEILPKLFNQVSKVATYQKIIADIWKSLWIFLAIYVVGVSLVFYLKYVKKLDLKAGKDKAKAILAQGDAKGFWVKAGLVLMLLVASTLLPILAYFGVIVGLVLLSFVPLIGWVSGQAYIDEAAINDRACAPLPSVQYYQAQKAQQDAKKPRDPKSQPQMAQCVKVLKDGEEVATGRLVLSTSKMVVLYLPDGVARRVPISDSVIEVVDKLATKDSQTSSRGKSHDETTAKAMHKRLAK